MKNNEEITFNSNGIKLNGEHLHGEYLLNGTSGYNNPKLPKKTISIRLNTMRRIMVPGLISRNDTNLVSDDFDYTHIDVMPNNRHYKKALVAYKKARSREVKREIKYLEKRILEDPKNIKIYQANLKKLERELKTLI